MSRCPVLGRLQLSRLLEPAARVRRLLMTAVDDQFNRRKVTRLSDVSAGAASNDLGTAGATRQAQVLLSADERDVSSE
jgi:hypothetical protein